MGDSLKLKRLKDLRDLMAAGKFRTKELKAMVLTDTDGRNVRMNEPDALEVLERRIAAEEAKPEEQQP